tara:strand:- start:3788 stop:4792 length:1005 start_codon:yes stop_codon:yes gene_type:complete
MKKTLIITTINKPNNNIKKFTRLCKKYKSNFIVIGDKKTPKNFDISYGIYYNIRDQKKIKFNFSKVCPTNSYARKNIGYLLSIKNKSDFIIETDDDNYPKDNFFNHIKLTQKVKEIKNVGWVNVYKSFIYNDKDIWPRGLPLNEIKKIPIFKNRKVKKSFYLQQGVCEGNPDVDAIYRIINKKINIKFKDKYTFSLGKSLSPINSQNTIWFKKLFTLMYLPVTCTMRTTDIWRGIIALNIILNDNLSVLFFGTTMKQFRNIHNLTNDLEQEMPLYKDISDGFKKLQNLNLKKGSKNYSNNLLKSYEALIEMKIFDKKEIFFLKAWIKDIKKILA